VLVDGLIILPHGEEFIIILRLIILPGFSRLLCQCIYAGRPWPTPLGPACTCLKLWAADRDYDT